MLRMDQVAVIRHQVENEERSIRGVAREMGMSRNTVRKYLHEAESTAARPVEPRVRSDRVRCRA